MHMIPLIIAASASTLTVVTGVAVFLIITLLLVAMLLIAKKFMVKRGDVVITVNNETEIPAEAGGSLLSTLAAKDVFLPSACGGKGSCGQCRVRVLSGGGEILPTETVHFSRKEIKEGWRLGCQVKVKQDMSIQVPASVLSVK